MAILASKEVGVYSKKDDADVEGVKGVGRDEERGRGWV